MAWQRMGLTDGKRMLMSIVIDLLGAVALLVFVNALPFCARIPGGWQWLGQYIPDGDDAVEGLLFFAFFASAPAIPLVILFWLRRFLCVTFGATLVVTSGALLFFHGTNDLAVDAQAALTLLFIPYLVTGLAIICALVCALPEVIIRIVRYGIRRSDGKGNSGNAAPHSDSGTG